MELSKFVSYRARMSGEFNSQKDSPPTKFGGRSRILVKLRFRGLSDSKLSGVRAFNNMAISFEPKRRYSYYYPFILCWQDVKILQLKYLHNRSYTNNSMLIKVNKLKLIRNNVKERKNYSNVIKKVSGSYPQYF